MPGYNDADDGSGDSGVIQAGGPSKDAVKKLDQIIQVWIYTVYLYSLLSKVLIPCFDRISTPKPLLSSYNLESHYPWSS